MSDRIYYKVPEGTKAFNHIKKYNDSHNAARVIFSDFAKRMGAIETDFYVSDGRLIALCFENNVPPNDMWKRDTKCVGKMRGFKVSGRTKEAKEIKDEWKGLFSAIDVWDFEEPFGRVFKNGRIPFTSLEWFSGVPVIGVPARAEMPEICKELIEIPTGEYYKMLGKQS